MAVATIIHVSFAVVYLNMLKKVNAIIRYFLTLANAFPFRHWSNRCYLFFKRQKQTMRSLYRRNNLGHFIAKIIMATSFLCTYTDRLQFDVKTHLVSQWKHIIYAWNKRTMRSLYRRNNLGQCISEIILVTSFLWTYTKRLQFDIKTHLVLQWKHMIDT